jgi:hypothetical protein
MTPTGCALLPLSAACTVQLAVLSGSVDEDTSSRSSGALTVGVRALAVPKKVPMVAGQQELPMPVPVLSGACMSKLF